MITPLLSTNLDLGKWSLGEFKKSLRGQSFASIYCGQSRFKLSDNPLYSKFGLGAFEAGATRLNLELTLEDPQLIQNISTIDDWLLKTLSEVGEYKPLVQTNEHGTKLELK